MTFTLETGDLVFHVEEGPLTKFGKVRFEGVRSLPTAELERFFDFEGSGFLFLGPVLLEPSKVDAAVSSVESAYHAEGFLRVDVGEPEIVWNAERTRADVLVRVEEGTRYTVAAATVSGAPRSLLGSPDPVGRPYRSTLPAQLAAPRPPGAPRRRLRVRRGDRLRPRSTTRRPRRASAIEAEPGEPIRLDEIRFAGNRATRRGFLRRRFDMRRGDVIRRDRLEQGVADLYRSRLFDAVQADARARRRRAARISRCAVEEAETKRLDLEVGWGSWDLLYGSFQYKDLNLFGHGRILRVGGLASFRTVRRRGAGGGSLDPRPGQPAVGDARGRPTRGPVLRLHRPYRRSSRSSGASTAIRQLWGGYRFRIEEATQPQRGPPARGAEEIDGFQRSAGPYVRYRYDRRDDLFTPTTGWIAEVAGLWSTPAAGRQPLLPGARASARRTTSTSRPGASSRWARAHGLADALRRHGPAHPAARTSSVGSRACAASTRTS